jgi:HEAT repeat protein
MNADPDDLLAAEDARITEALRVADFRVGSIFDLVNSQEPYPSAVPVLVRLLRDVRHDRIKEGVARALTVPGAKSFVGSLIDEFRRMEPNAAPGEHAKWAIGNAISVAGHDDVFDEVVALMRDVRHGWTRAMLPLAMLRMKKHRAEAVRELIASLSDDEIALQSVAALVRLKAPEAIDALKRLTSHTNKDVQQAAAKALKKAGEGLTGRGKWGRTSNADVATIKTFTALTSHQSVSSTAFTEILAAVNLARQAVGWPAVQWSNILSSNIPLPQPGAVIRAGHITSCRARMNEALQALNVAVYAYTDSDVTGKPMKVQHLQEVQGRIK